jgi:hypothetical protein
MIDNNLHGTQFTLVSGFSIIAKPLPPYYNDFIEDALPLIPLPKRTLHLKAGDSIDVEYLEPAEFPSDTDEQELYLRYKTAVSDNITIESQRKRAKMNYLINTCIEIVSGPIEESDMAWKNKIQQSLPNYVLPTDPGLLHVAFVKSQVITTQLELDSVLSACFYPEVNIQGIVNALSHFQDKISGSRAIGVDTAASGAR